MRDRALFNKARLLEQKGAGKDAEKVYRDILTELPTERAQGRDQRSPGRDRGQVIARVALVLAARCRRAAGCFGRLSAATVRRADQPGHEYPAGVTSLRWRTPIHQRELFEPRPEECASGAVVGDRLIIGSRAGQVVALGRGRRQDALADAGLGRRRLRGPLRSPATARSTSAPTTASSTPSSPTSGKIRWSYRGKGAIERRPELGGDAIYVTSAADRVVALEPRTGKSLWQYEREAPEGFTIHGHAGPRLHRGIVYTGFSDGFLMALNAGTGDVVWARSLAAASEQYVDVDSTPAAARRGRAAGLVLLRRPVRAVRRQRRRALAPGHRGRQRRAGDRRSPLLRRAPRRPDRAHR